MRAISSFNLEAGISTFWCRALIELRMRVSMSATGSVNLIVCFSSVARLLRVKRRTCGDFFFGHPTDGRPYGTATCLYQDDLETPGISPRNASPRKHKRQMPNLRKYARGRPQILQRLCLRVENLGFFTFCGLTLLSAPSFTRFAVVAT